LGAYAVVSLKRPVAPSEPKTSSVDTCRKRNASRAAPASRAPSGRARPPKVYAPLVPAWAVAMLLGSAAAWLLAQDWIAALGIWVLWTGWRSLRVGIGSPVLALAFTFQWVQVMAGVYYHAVTRSPLPAMDLLDYRPMLLIGLGCLAALLIGLVLGMRWMGGAVSADAVPESAAAPAIGPQRGPEVIEHGPHLRGHHRGRSEQHGRVEVALQRHPVVDAPARLRERHRPVEADHVGTAVGDGLEPRAAALGEDDARHHAAVALARQRGQHLPRVL